MSALLETLNLGCELGGAWHIVPVFGQSEIEAWFRRGGCAGRLSSQTAKKGLSMTTLARLPRRKRPAEFQCKYLRAKTTACILISSTKQ
jgi:hypothetical protein